MKTYMPHDQAADKIKGQIRERLLSGETIGYDDAEQIDDMRWAELHREMPIYEVPGDGYRMGIDPHAQHRADDYDADQE